MKRIWAAFIAAIAWFGLGLQLDLTLSAATGTAAGLTSALVTYFSYFTHLTGIATAGALTLTVRYPQGDRPWNRPGANAALAVYITVVAVVYALLLERLNRLQNLSLLADTILHDALPALFLVYWALYAPKGGVPLREIGNWLIFPGLYLAYVLVRGNLTGKYPYPFLNAARLGDLDIFGNGLGLLAFFLALSLAFLSLGNALARMPVKGGCIRKRCK